MWTSVFETLVRICCRHAKGVLGASLIAALGAGVYVSQHFEMDSNAENLISEDLAWRRNQAEFDRAFPQRNNLTLVVLDGATPERTEEAAAALKKAIAERKDLFPVVRDIQGDPFFAHNGLLFLPLDGVRDTTQHIIMAQPFLGPLAADPSLRGIMDGLSTALVGVENNAANLEDLTRPVSAFSDTLEKTTAGRSAFLSWQALISGISPTTRETRRLIEVQAALDYSRLAPGEVASEAIRKIATDLDLTPEHGVSLRLTGPVPLADEEFATLLDHVELLIALMMSAILLMLWLAVRSLKIIVAILVTLFAGLAITTALGLAVIGTFNLLSVAFIPLFVGIGVDFGIQYSVRYRAERHALKDLEAALLSAGASMGPPLTVAAAATAACFFSLTPTDYAGLAQLGFIAGSGMIIAFLLSGTLLPALIKLLRPKGEEAEIGFARLAFLDRFLHRRQCEILASTAILVAIGLSLLPFLSFNADPLDLRSQRTESVASLLDLMKDPDTSPNTIDILVPSLASADEMSSAVSKLPEVDKALTLQSFIPDRQPEKLALISDAALLMDTTLNPFDTKPAPTLAETKASIAAAKDQLRKVAGNEVTQAAEAARRLADRLEQLEKADSAVVSLTDAALVPGLNTVLMQLRAALAPQPVNAEILPADLRREWVAPDGRARVQAFMKGDANDDDTVQKFADAVRRLAPNATGAPISTQESGRTVVSAFVRAGILSLFAMAMLLAITLRKFKDVVLTLIPLITIGILTFATCVVLGLELNFANIIVLPLLFGIGVAFNIYFIMSWRAGSHDFLRSSLTRAVVFSAATTASGFGMLWLSSHPGTASMGELLSISLFWTLVTTLFFLPALLESASPR